MLELKEKKISNVIELQIAYTDLDHTLKIM